MAHSVVLVVPGDIETRTGGYEYDRRLMVALRARGWRVDLLSLPDGFPFPSSDARQRTKAALATLPDETLVMVDGLALGVLPQEVAPHATRLRLVALVHHPLALESGLSDDVAEALRESETRVLRFCRAVVVTSEATKRALAAYQADAERVTVAVPGTVVAPVARGSGGGPLRLLTVGSLVPRKGYDILLKALGGLRDLDWELACGGSTSRDPDTARAIRELASTLGLEARIHFLGELSESALAAEYDRADVFVLATRYEGFGMVIAEALARGLPVVASDTGGIGALLERGGGRLCPPSDEIALQAALREVLGEAALRERLAREARDARSLLPTWDDTARAVERAFLAIGAA